MSEFCITLPEEIWIHILGFLSVRDKFNARLACTCFKKLIDHWALWKDSTIALRKVGPYEMHFWKTLRQRKIKSIVVRRASVKVVRPIVTHLPWVSSLTLEECYDATALETLGALKHLESLVIHTCCCLRALISSLLSLRQLTHLCLCEVPKRSASEICTAVSQLASLTTLSYHDNEKNPLVRTDLHGMLRRLPNLKHFSLRLGPNYGLLPDDYLCPEASPGAEFRLSNLELLNYEDPCLSTAAFCGLSHLSKLTVHYQRRREASDPCSLTKWLRELHVLSELNISLGNPLGVYARSIPGTVRRLSLMAVKGDLKAVRIMAEQVPDLLHLHMDLYSYDICKIIEEIPRIFPKLQILKLRHRNVPASVLLQLQHLPRLKQLVILDAPETPSPVFLELTQKLHVQTNYRIQLLHFNSKDQITCSCGFY